MKLELGKAVLWEKMYQQHTASWDGRAMETSFFIQGRSCRYTWSTQTPCWC